MKRTGKRLLAVVLCIALCMTISPVSVFAQFGSLSEDGKTITDSEPSTTMASTSWGDIPSNWHGFVMKYSYDEANNRIGIDVGMYNAPFGSIFESYFKFDTNKLQFLDKSYAVPARPSINNVINIANMSNDLVVAAGSDAPEVIANQPVIGGDYSLFDALDTSTSSVSGGGVYTTVQLKLANVLKPENEEFPLSNDFKNFLDADLRNVRFIFNDVVPLYSVYFGFKGSNTIEDIDANTFFWGTNASIAESSKGANIKDAEGDIIASGVYQIGFPLPPEPTGWAQFTIKGTDGEAIKDSTITFRGNSYRDHTDISDPKYTCITDASGVAKIQLPVGNNYNFFVGSGTSAAGDTYTFSGAGHAGTFSVSESNTEQNPAPVSYTSMIKRTSAYPIRIKAVDAAGAPVDLKNTTLNFGDKLNPMAQDTGTATAEAGVRFTVATGGDKTLRLSGVDGFQNITGDTMQFRVTPAMDGGVESLDVATITVVTDLGAAAKATMKNDTEGSYIELQLKKTVTEVKIPIPVPEGITPEQAAGIKVTVTPAEGSSDVIKGELGGGLVISGQPAIQVETDGEGNVTGITVTVPLPDGSFDMVVGGNGLDNGSSIPVTVVTDDSVTPTKHVVNIGGTPTLDGNGDVTKIEGGVTADSAGEPDAATGNSSIDLTGGDSGVTMVQGGTTTVDSSTGSVTPPVSGSEGVTDVTDILDSGILNEATPVVMTERAYMVSVTENRNGSNATMIDSFTAEVELKNIDASSGYFGMYFDPTVFDGANVTAVLNTSAGIELRNIANTGSATGLTIDATNGYVVIGWQVNTNGEYVPSGTKIATITLPVKSNYRSETDLATVVDDRSIYTVDFTQTSPYTQMRPQGTTGGMSADGLDYALNAVWRPLGSDGVNNSQHLADDKATRGGFYQAYAYNQTAGYDVAHDIRMLFELPELFAKTRVDFWVTETGTTKGIVGANVVVFDQVYDPKAEPAQVPLKTLTTDENGYAHISLDEGQTYYYYVSSDSHWAYPDGTAKTDTDNLDYDGFQITELGVVMQRDVYPLSGGGYGKTLIVSDYINPQMTPKTYHVVSLVNGTSTTTQAAITSSTTAYNLVDYLFSLEPAAGYEWNLNNGEALGDAMQRYITAGYISVKVYEADQSSADSDTDEQKYHTGSGNPLTVTWDTTRDQFKIEGSAITGNSRSAEDLRAGDIEITIDETNTLKQAEYTITATAGTGGTVEATDIPTTPASTVEKKGSDGSYGAYDNTPITGELRETLGQGGETSAKYKFMPTGTNQIKEVIINGVTQTITDTQKKTGFTYQFEKVAGDQTIYVSFADEEGNVLSDPYVSLTVGAKGGVTVSAVDATGGTVDLNGAAEGTDDKVTGPATETYTVPAGKMTLKIKADDDFEIDQILVITLDENGNPETNPISKEAAKDESGYYTKELSVDRELRQGDNESIIITFKPKDGPSTQAVVTSMIADGFGTLTYLGVKIYPMGATPTYTMKADANWEVIKTNNPGDTGSVNVNDVDRSTDIVAPTDASGEYTYTLPALTGDVTLKVTFFETTVKVQGQIKVAKDQYDVAAATLKFTRAADETTGTDEVVIPVTSGTTASSYMVGWEVKLPAGVWKIEVEKDGYLRYTITEFELKAAQGQNGTPTVVYFGDTADSSGIYTSTSSSSMKAIELIPGDAAGDKLAVELSDAAVIVAGWLNGALEKNRTMGDVNESTNSPGGSRQSGTDDMSILTTNLYKEEVNQSYAQFLT